MNPNYPRGCTAFLRSGPSRHINRLRSIFPLELQQRSCNSAALQSSLMAEHLNALDVGSPHLLQSQCHLPVFFILSHTECLVDVKIGTFNQMLAVLIVRSD